MRRTTCEWDERMGDETLWLNGRLAMTTRNNDSRERSGGRHAASLRRMALVALAALLVSATGCRTMTSAKERALEQEEVAKEQAAIEAAAAAAERRRMEAENARLLRQSLEIQYKAERQRKIGEAAAALSGGDADGALASIADALNPRPLIDPSTGEALVDPETNQPLEPPAMQSQLKAQVFLIRGTAKSEAGDSVGAVEDLRESLKLDGGQRDARRNLGQILFQARDYAGALKAWGLELADGYRDGNMLFLIGQASYELYHETQRMNPAYLEAARSALDQALVGLPDNPDLMRWLAIVQYEGGRYREAIRLFEGILKAKPLDPEYLELLANSYINLEDYQTAIRYLELSAALKKPSKRTMSTLADLYVALNLVDRGAYWMVQKTGDDPTKASPADRLLIGQLFSEAGRVDDAVRWFGAVQSDNAEYSKAQSSLAYLYQDLGRSGEAVAAFEQAAASEPDNGAGLLALGDIYLERKDREKAYEAYTKASALPDTAADGFAGLAEVYYAKKNLAQAAKQYEAAIQANPGDGRYAAALAEIQDEIRFKAEAERRRAQSR